MKNRYYVYLLVLVFLTFLEYKAIISGPEWLLLCLLLVIIGFVLRYFE
ncbi:MAG: hypothetical protein LKJ22_03830 [Liquorilactobacillus nagelii]|jgi:uncharacterized membrane protein|nr:hypothetical protein [Liquorilactobacillus nagelii]MCI1921037.1 hypothetical protein [Liquorilactobacillus nagelii]